MLKSIDSMLTAQKDDIKGFELVILVCDFKETTHYLIFIHKRTVFILNVESLLETTHVNQHVNLILKYPLHCVT